MRNLFVLFDSSCELCIHCKSWLQAQRQTVALTFLPAQSTEAQRVFPLLDHSKTLDELTVIADTGEIYHGAKAWLMCLWALKDFRNWSYTMASPEMLPKAKRFISMISDNRKSINKLLVYRG